MTNNIMLKVIFLFLLEISIVQSFQKPNPIQITSKIQKTFFSKKLNNQINIIQKKNFINTKKGKANVKITKLLSTPTPTTTTTDTSKVKSEICNWINPIPYANLQIGVPKGREIHYITIISYIYVYRCFHIVMSICIYLHINTLHYVK